MIRKVSDSYKNNIFHIIFGPLLKLFEAVFDLLIPLFMKAVIDLNQYGDVELISNKLTYALAKFIRLLPSFNLKQETSDAIIGGIIILVMGVIGFVITMLAQYIAARTAAKIGTEVRDSLFDKILHLSRRQKEKLGGTSHLVTTLNSDSYAVERGVQIFIRLTARAPFIIIGSLIFSFVLDWRIGLAFTAIVPMLLAVIFIVLHKAEKNYVGIQKKLDSISKTSSDTIEGARVVRAFDKQEEANEKFLAESGDYQRAAKHVNKINALINPLTFAITAIVLIVIMFIIKPTMINGDEAEKTLLASTMIAEMAYLAQIFFTTVQLTGVLLDITKAGVSRKRIDEVLLIEDDIVSGEEKLEDNSLELLKYEHVYFAFGDNKEKYTLKDIDFSIDKGETLGIIGGTGSGKSMIINLLERFYDVSKGAIYFKGKNIRNIDLLDLRSSISLVNQKSSLFKGDIRNHFLMAKPTATDEEMITALKKAEAYDFVMEKGGLNASIEESGSNFSGGQRQRLCIARALLRESDLLILDDSTSALDLLTDKKIRQEIAKLKDTSKIIISQRVATISDADLILVMDHGEVVAKGTHNELLKTSPIYKEIYETQIRKG